MTINNNSKVRIISSSSRRRPLFVKDGLEEEMLIHVAPIIRPIHRLLASSKHLNGACTLHSSLGYYRACWERKAPRLASAPCACNSELHSRIPIQIGCQRHILLRHRHFVSKSPHRRKWSGIPASRFALTRCTINFRSRMRKLGLLL